jgi:hypothetical protein
LYDLIEIRFAAFECDAVPCGARDQSRHDEMRRSVADDAKAKWDQRRKGQTPRPRLGNHLRQPNQLVLVQGIPRQRPDAQSQALVPFGYASTPRGKIIGQPREPSELGVEPGAHL